NLVVNAVDASAEGGEIELETQLCTLSAGEHAGLDAGQDVRMSVADRGQGMSPDVVKRIFEPFFTTKPPGKGTGLGLSRVYGFVKQSGGAGGVARPEGAGTCFRIYLPTSTAAPHQDHAAGAEHIAVGRPLRILL